jgi:hypothetical protein
MVDFGSECVNIFGPRITETADNLIRGYGGSTVYLRFMKSKPPSVFSRKLMIVSKYTVMFKVMGLKIGCVFVDSSCSG